MPARSPHATEHNNEEEKRFMKAPDDRRQAAGAGRRRRVGSPDPPAAADARALPMLLCASDRGSCVNCLDYRSDRFYFGLLVRSEFSNVEFLNS